MSDERWDTPSYRKVSARIGEKFNNLTIIDILKERNKDKQIVALCKCSLCGGTKILRASKVISSYYKSCGCLARYTPEKYIGNTYNELTIVGVSKEEHSDKAAYVVCRCSCGARKTLRLSLVVGGKTRSCGHLKAASDPSQYVGKTFGMLKVLNVVGIVKHAMTVTCLCSCGIAKNVKLTHLIHGSVTSCGCKGKIKNPEDYIGYRFGSLTISDVVPDPRGMGRAVVLCHCACGKAHTARLSSILNGDIVSCGCGKRTRDGITTIANGKPYGVWRSMMKRCYQSKDFKTSIPELKFLEGKKETNSYQNYGARGITVCKEWWNAAVFIKWYMDNIKSGESMDRIDNNGNYTPDNVRSTTAVMQANNQRARKDGSSTGYTGIYTQGNTYYWRVRYDNNLMTERGVKSLLKAIIDRNLYILENNFPNRLNTPKEKCEVGLLASGKDQRTWQVSLTDKSGKTHLSERRRLKSNEDKILINKLTKSLKCE